MTEIEKVWPSWQVESKIGEGGFGTVYKAKKELFGEVTWSAIKTVSIPNDPAEVKDMSASGLDENSIRGYYQESVKQLVNEIRLMEKMKSASHIVAIEDYEVVEDRESLGWTIFIRMELLKNLNDYIKEHGMDTKAVIQMGEDILTGLEFCHESNLIHRDIKPANIFVSEFGEYKIGDFGISREIERTSTTLSQKGTKTYMAPEIVRMEKYDKRVDIYALGLTMYEICNKGRMPFLPPYPQPYFPMDREKAILRRLNGDTFPELPEIGALNQVIWKACAFAPEDRYQSALEMKEALLSLGKTEVPEKTEHSDSNRNIRETEVAADTNQNIRETEVAADMNQNESEEEPVDMDREANWEKTMTIGSDSLSQLHQILGKLQRGEVTEEELKADKEKHDSSGKDEKQEVSDENSVYRMPKEDLKKQEDTCRETETSDGSTVYRMFKEGLDGLENMCQKTAPVNTHNRVDQDQTEQESSCHTTERSRNGFDNAKSESNSADKEPRVSGHYADSDYAFRHDKEDDEPDLAITEPLQSVCPNCQNTTYLLFLHGYVCPHCKDIILTRKNERTLKSRKIYREADRGVAGWASKMYEDLLKLTPYSAQLHMWISIENSQDFEKRRKHIKEALELDDRDASIYEEAAQIAIHDKDYEKAVDYEKKALEMWKENNNSYCHEPLDQYIYTNCSKALHFQGKEEEAFQWMLKVRQCGSGLYKDMIDKMEVGVPYSQKEIEKIFKKYRKKFAMKNQMNLNKGNKSVNKQIADVFGIPDDEIMYMYICPMPISMLEDKTALHGIVLTRDRIYIYSEEEPTGYYFMRYIDLAHNHEIKIKDKYLIITNFLAVEDEPNKDVYIDVDGKAGWLLGADTRWLQCVLQEIQELYTPQN